MKALKLSKSAQMTGKSAKGLKSGERKHQGDSRKRTKKVWKRTLGGESALKIGKSAHLAKKREKLVV